MLLVARGLEQLEETCEEIDRRGGSAYIYPADISDPESVDALLERVLAEHPQIDILVNNAGRSIRRSIALSYDRFHDFERTMQLNYLGTIRLIMGAAARHARAPLGPRHQHLLDRRADQPAAVLGLRRVEVGTRCLDAGGQLRVHRDNVHFTTIHMPLVKTPMIAPTKMYDRFPTISPEQAAEMIAEAIRTRPKTVEHRTSGPVGEVSYALFPKLVDQVLSTAYKVFPDSAAARGQGDPAEHASTEQALFARLMRGVHW